jgi:cytochrome c553
MTTLRRWVAPALLLTVPFLAGGCAWAFGSREGDLPEMHQRFSRTFDVQTGLIHGDLGQVRSAAAWIASREDGIELSSEAEAYSRRLVQKAEALAQAQDLQEAAAATATLAASCGDCHQALGRGPRFVVGQSSPQGTSQEAQMIRHLWAADRMWEGLVGPSEESWQAGAAALAETGPALVHALRASTSSGPGSSLVNQVQSAADQALAATTWSERAEVYGQMLGTCNGCHSATGVKVAER